MTRKTKIINRGARDDASKEFNDHNKDDSSEARGNEESHGEEDRKKLWMKAIKPPMYSVGFIPVLVAAAATDAGIASLRCGAFVLAAILVIAWLNLSNDAFDSHTGVDKTKKESVVNLTGSPTLVLWTANVCLAAGVSLLWYLITSIQEPTRPAMMLAGAIACGYVYQGPPFRLSYKGLGEPLCFLAFGLLATPAFYLSLLPSNPSLPSPLVITPLVWLLGILVGLTTTIILFTSHFHQIEGDKAAGKMSPLVRLGTDRATMVLRCAVLAPYLLAALYLAAHLIMYFPGSMGLTLPLCTFLSLPFAINLINFAEANHRVPAVISSLKIYATKFHMAYGASLILGLTLGKR
jgi:1,4-dihydroxy-2-naphthoate phytyltransferase